MGIRTHLWNAPFLNRTVSVQFNAAIAITEADKGPVINN